MTPQTLALIFLLSGAFIGAWEWFINRGRE